ncbi:ATP-binding protein [Cupriavidus sp. BIC8F]|uniref:ATP-binding protein n=1 Tax=Cupriavidus sp. BIC8F TaxID=3079014 RepID=UPI0029160277|nr:ATP-binding protein [Cupriavidus sp. BIC8F]
MSVLHASGMGQARPAFPFAALIGQSALQQALLLAAIDPGIGGVLVSGPRGTAKSTAARALAELLPEGQLVTLPLGASEDRLIGTLDLETVLRENTVRFSPGLLAKAHQGVLYVDEVNLLPDALVDALLDVAASGVNTVERDGISHSHDAHFVLVGTMNPEEGELRAQLTDRFGLMIELENCFDPRVRQQIVKARLAFELDPQAFRARYRREQDAYVQRIVQARTAIAALDFNEAVHERVSTLCIAAAVDGLRADLVMLRAARALAAYEQAGRVTPGHVDRVAASVLLHRRHAQDDSKSLSSGRAEGNATPRKDEPSSSAAGTANAEDNHQHLSDSADWGYLPPDPVGIDTVKGVLPLRPKKR